MAGTLVSSALLEGLEFFDFGNPPLDRDHQSHFVERFGSRRMTTEGATDGEWRHSDGEKGLLQPTDDVQVSGPRRVRNRDKVVSNAQRKDQRRRQRTLIAQLDKVREQEERERERARARAR